MSANIMDVRPTENENQQGQDDAGKGIGTIFIVLALVFLCFNLAFIIPDLIYAYQDSACVLTHVDGISFPLKTWLQVDAYLRIGFVTLLLIVAIGFCCSLNLGATLAICAICTMMLYSLFSLAWTIVGSVLFWGKLNPTGVCDGPIRSYMYALLIITYVSICCNCVFNSKMGKSQTEEH